MQGSRTAVLEAETIGWGASSRNGGMTLTGLKVSMGDIIKMYGREVAKRLFQCSLDSVDAVEQIVKEENIDCDFSRRGHLLTANKPKHYEAILGEVEFMEKEFNYKVTAVPQAEIKSEIGSDAYFGAMVDVVSGGLNPAQYVTGLAKAAVKAGAELCDRARVRNIERVIGSFHIETERGEVFADKILVATSGYTGAVTKKLQQKVIPIGSYIIATEPLPVELAKQLIPHRRMVFDYKHYLHYYRLSADNRMVFGGRAAFMPETTKTIRESAAILQREMNEVFPSLKDIKIEYEWGGTLDFTFDMMTHVGEMEGMFYSLGYAGHGVAMATYLGKTVAEAMLHGGIEEHPFAVYPFPGAPLGLYNGNPWFLPLAGLWYKILDLIE
jgi:glycine/D-amino acid oxidase-like deaminating enzyme